MKSSKILLLVFGLILLLSSCSKKSDPQPATTLSSASLSLSTGQVVTPPPALTNSTDSHAQEVNAFIQSANALSSLTSQFTPPAGATKSSTPIVGVNVGGRVSSTQQNYLVYIWSDPNSGGSVAYQISETTDSYTFELFIKETGASVWVRFLFASEKKDKSSGFLKVYDPTITKVSPPTLTYSWTRGTNTLNFIITDDSTMKVTMNINTQTKAGDVEAYTSGVLFEKLTWDANGHGTWAAYDTDGITVTDSGTW
jgi:hypothetical protein